MFGTPVARGRVSSFFGLVLPAASRLELKFATMVGHPRWQSDECYIVVSGTGRCRMEDKRLRSSRTIWMVDAASKRRRFFRCAFRAIFAGDECNSQRVWREPRALRARVPVVG